MEFYELETDRLKLVQIKEDHTQRLFEIMSNKEVTKLYGMDRLTELDQAAQFVSHFQLNFDKKKGIRWGIIGKETGDFIGTVGLNNLRITSRRAEIGYELDPSYWKNGFASEAVRVALSYSFDELNLNRMGAVTYPQNRSSIQLLTKIGFSEEGVMRGYLYQNNESHDALLFSILQSEWKSEKV